MSIWQPKSIFQLLLIGFLIVVAPLGMAILYTVQTLGDLSEKNRAVTAEVIKLNRQGQEMQRDLLDLERRGRQYLALKSEEILVLFDREKETIRNNLKNLDSLVGEGTPMVSALSDGLSKLQPTLKSEQQLLEQFKTIANRRAELERWMTKEVDRRIRDHAVESDAIKDSLLLMVLFMVLATLALMLFFGHWINRPIQNIVDQIRLLGDKGLTKKIKISGPQEVQTVGRQLEWLRTRLDEIDQQKVQFLRHISHELKTPLANLREGSDLLAEQVLGPLSTNQQEVTTIVQHNAVELQRLIENLLDYNQLPDHEIEPELIAIPELLEALLANYRISLESKQVTIRRNIMAKSVRTDRKKLTVALDNIISNAVNYAPEAGIIEITAAIEQECLEVSVANSGRAIPEQEKAHLFKPFYQGSSERIGPIKGSGIGLSVAKECMEAQGGLIELIEHPSLAVCFRLICPCTK